MLPSSFPCRLTSVQQADLHKFCFGWLAVPWEEPGLWTSKWAKTTHTLKVLPAILKSFLQIYLPVSLGTLDHNLVYFLVYLSTTAGLWIGEELNRTSCPTPPTPNFFPSLFSFLATHKWSAGHFLEVLHRASQRKYCHYNIAFCES